MIDTPHQLRNHLSKAEARKLLAVEPFSRRVISFYRYVILSDPKQLRDELFAEWVKLGILGRIYVAKEGINAQMSVPEPNFEAFQKLLYKCTAFHGVPFKVGVEQEDDAFWKLTIKVKRQIVADGLQPGDYDVTNVGAHLSAREFNDMLKRPETVVVDMRNNYESVIGHFEGAICPPAYTFKEELPLVKEALKGQEDKEVLLYCTGGIRCEKASSYLKHHGFQNVYQLHGGIIDYKHQIQREGLPSQFKGKNFVFDNRLGERITDDVLAKCYQCDSTCDDYTNCENVECNLLFIQCAACKETFAGCCGVECQAIAELPETEQLKLRKGKVLPKNAEAFKKKVAVTC
ncbi:MAG: rhodanese-related sulfurtransferase [Candidatus Moranbacteria bacterium]|nr:rhodanese-related sulfurtransferase [Candidatus Moranbacteria bacterium]